MSVKRTYVKPHVREGEPVEGYWRPDVYRDSGSAARAANAALALGLDYDVRHRGVWFPKGEDSELVFDADEPQATPNGHALWKALHNRALDKWALWVPNTWSDPHHYQVMHKLGWRALDIEMFSGYGTTSAREAYEQELPLGLEEILKRHASVLSSARERAKSVKDELYVRAVEFT